MILQGKTLLVYFGCCDGCIILALCVFMFVQRVTALLILQICLSIVAKT